MRLYLLIFLSVLLSLTVSAGDGSAPAPRPVPSSPRATIEKCLSELKNSNPQIRRSAALVLGKYPRHPLAWQGLTDCLKDEDAEIRQCALVSLTEGPMIMPPVREHIYPMFQDPDVHIRRIATSLLRQLVRPAYSIYLGGRYSRNSRNDRLAPLARKHANAALKDPDISVRRNILAGAVYQPDLIDTVNLLPFFQDERDELVILALQIYRNHSARAEDRIRHLDRLSGHPNPHVRKLVAEQLLQLAGSAETSGKALPVLRKLYRDSSPEVRMTAIRGMMLSGSDELLPRMEEILKDRDLPQQERRSLVLLLHQFGVRSLPVLRSLMQGSQPLLREEAMKVLALYPREVLSDEDLIRALSDEIPGIRRQAVSLLRRRRYVFREPELRKLLRSPHADLRGAVLQLIPASQSHLLREAVLELCMDDDLQIRCQALSRLPGIRPEGWTDILTASLEDENPQIQETAVRNLLHLSSPEILDALQAYLPKCRNSYLKRRLEFKLKPRR